MDKKVIKNIGFFSTTDEDLYNPIDILKALGYKNALKVWNEIKSDDFDGVVAGVLSYYKGKPKMLEMTNLDGVIRIFKKHNISCKNHERRKVVKASIILEDTYSFIINIK